MVLVPYVTALQMAMRTTNQLADQTHERWQCVAQGDGA
jgi:hypothetical protein